MLTWENFHNSWAKAKPQHPPKVEEEMIVDQVVGDGKSDAEKSYRRTDDAGNGSVGAGTEMDVEINVQAGQRDTSEMVVEKGNIAGAAAGCEVFAAGNAGAGRMVEGRSSLKRRMPVFAFQRRGIGDTQRRHQFSNSGRNQTRPRHPQPQPQPRQDTSLYGQQHIWK